MIVDVTPADGQGTRLRSPAGRHLEQEIPLPGWRSSKARSWRRRDGEEQLGAFGSRERPVGLCRARRSSRALGRWRPVRRRDSIRSEVSRIPTPSYFRPASVNLVFAEVPFVRACNTKGNADRRSKLAGDLDTTDIGRIPTFPATAGWNRSKIRSARKC